MAQAQTQDKSRMTLPGIDPDSVKATGDARGRIVALTLTKEAAELYGNGKKAGDKVRRVDYIHERFYAHNAPRALIVKEVNMLQDGDTKDVSYQTVFGATKTEEKPTPKRRNPSTKKNKGANANANADADELGDELEAV